MFRLQSMGRFMSSIGRETRKWWPNLPLNSFLKAETSRGGDAITPSDANDAAVTCRNPLQSSRIRRWWSRLGPSAMLLVRLYRRHLLPIHLALRDSPVEYSHFAHFLRRVGSRLINYRHLRLFSCAQLMRSVFHPRSVWASHIAAKYIPMFVDSQQHRRWAKP